MASRFAARCCWCALRRIAAVMMGAALAKMSLPIMPHPIAIPNGPAPRGSLSGLRLRSKYFSQIGAQLGGRNAGQALDIRNPVRWDFFLRPPGDKAFIDAELSREVDQTHVFGSEELGKPRFFHAHIVAQLTTIVKPLDCARC